MGNFTVLGMDLTLNEDSALANAQPLCGFVVIKGIDRDGDLTYLTAATDGLTAVECLGMAEYAALKIKRGLSQELSES